MSRTTDLLQAIADRLRALTGPDGALFRDVRVEFDRYDLGQLLAQKIPEPAARICFMRAASKLGAHGGIDRDVSVVIAVVAGRRGRPTPEISSADAHALDLLDAVAGMILADPYVGLGQLTAAQLGDQLVAVADASNKEGVSIALIECAWTLLDAAPPPAINAQAIGLTIPAPPVVIRADGNQIAPEPSP
jgi:hypothetical protein